MESTTKLNIEIVNDTNNATAPWTPTEIALAAVPLAIIILWIIAGNLLVCTAILTQKNLRTPSNIYILSLAITDLCVGVFILPLNVKDMIHGWTILPVWLCRLWLTADVTLCSASILQILAIAVDRFRSINEGLRYATSRSKTSSMIHCCALWLLALWIASPPILGWNDWEGSSPNECFLTRELGYIVHSASGAFFIPAIVMVGLYVRIYFLLKKKFRERSTMKCIQEPQSSHDLDHSSGETNSQTNKNASRDTLDSVCTNKSTKKSLKISIKKGLSFSSDTDNVDSGNEGGDEKEDKSPKSENLRNQVLSKQTRKHSEQITEILKQKKKHSLSKERKATITLGILIGAFIICWAPFTLYYLCSGIFGPSFVSVPIFQTFTWLGYINSGLNPVIYTKYNPEFRKAFKVLLLGWRSDN